MSPFVSPPVGGDGVLAGWPPAALLHAARSSAAASTANRSGKTVDVIDMCYPNGERRVSATDATLGLRPRLAGGELWRCRAGCEPEPVPQPDALRRHRNREGPRGFDARRAETGGRAARWRAADLPAGHVQRHLDPRADREPRGHGGSRSNA